MKLPRLVKFLLVLALLGVLGGVAYVYRNVITRALWSIKPPGESASVQGVLKEDLKESDFKVIASGLKIPWDLAFLPDGSILVTERPGMIKRIAPDGSVVPVAGVSGTKQIGESGLLGVALHPKFSDNRWVYIYQTVAGAGGTAQNRVDRYRLEGDALSERTTIIQNIPGAVYHDGGEVAFGPDGKLYLTTGDATVSVQSQNLNSLAGKVLRLNDDGTIPSDNPFGTAVWSYGHRNPQGLAWDRQGRLWATEHGRSGVLSGLDELNLIEPGVNYGWPTIQGDETADGMRAPAVHSGPDETWAPSGLAFFGDSMFFSGLRGESLYQAMISKDPIVIKAHFEEEYGRIRAVAVGPDRMIYFTTSNTDGRGVPKEGDDKIIRVNPRLFQ